MTPSELLSATMTRAVTLADTATAWGEQFPAAASTPFVLGLSEVACHEAIAPQLAADEVTVGTSATITHLIPSPVGAQLIAKAVLVERAGRRLTYDVDVHDGEHLAARVTHTRAIVQRSRILALLEGSA